LVQNLATIWGALSCGFDIDAEKFGQLCEETERIYFDEHNGVGWYSLPPTLHKIFKHGKDIIRECPLPIGLTNEEASEANNKYLRSFRFHHTRKTSWKDGIQDLFHRLMDISDPLIQQTDSVHTARSKTRKALSPQILALLKPPMPNEQKALGFKSDDESDN
jgi:hypothetical protein